jgi:hypothetical protein
MNRKLILAIKRFRKGEPVWLPDLRKLVPMSKEAFDAAILELAKSGKYFLSKHCHPAQSTEEEKAGFIPDGQGNYYITINPSDDIEAPITDDVVVKSSLEPVTDTAAPPSKLGRGGSREGAGRPVVKMKFKRVPLAGARVPGWLMEWLKAKGDMGRVIEAALIERYKLNPPE